MQKWRFHQKKLGANWFAYFRDAEIDGTNLGDVLVEFVRNARNKDHGELRFEGNGIRGYVEADFYPATTLFNSFAYLKKYPNEYLKSLVITHVMIEPRKQIDEAMGKLFEQTDIEAVAITSVVLEEVKQYFLKNGWELYRESDLKITRK